VIDLHEGVAEIFAAAQQDDGVDHGDLRFDSDTARSLTYEAAFIAQARLAEGVTRWRCATCGEEVEQRPGVRVAFHMGNLRDSNCGRREAPRDFQETQNRLAVAPALTYRNSSR
jgi:hypothetical protein